MPEYCLRCHRLGKRFGLSWVFRGLDLELQGGQTLVVIGPNGSGKSTLLKLVAGLLQPTEGEIALRVNGEVLENRPRWVGWAATDGALYGALSALEHLRWWATLHNLPISEEGLITHLQRYELAAYAHHWVRTFSTGMRQRLRLAIATLCRPPVLLLDEPGAGLDEAGKRLLEQTLHEHGQSGIVILATNDPGEYRYATLHLRLGA